MKAILDGDDLVPFLEHESIEWSELRASFGSRRMASSWKFGVKICEVALLEKPGREQYLRSTSLTPEGARSC